MSEMIVLSLTAFLSFVEFQEEEAWKVLRD